jgi:hypothetical protein
MKFITNSIISKILLILFLILIGVVISYFLKDRPSKKIAKKNKINQVLETFISHKHSLWVEGDIEGLYAKGKLECPKYLAKDMAVHSSFFECNPLYYLCRTKELEKFNGFNFKFIDYQTAAKGEFIVSYKLNNIDFSLKFKDSCRSVYLEPKLYSTGMGESAHALWDNYAERVYIDKQYVNKLDQIWSDEKRLENIQDPHKPLLNLTSKKMKEICYKLGGQLLENRYFDAAVNFPSTIIKNVVNKYPYPWTKKRRLKEKDSLCYKSFNQNCTNIPYIYHSDYSPSWIGIYHSLGSFMEYLENKMVQDFNIKVSSRYIPFESEWNQNFLRSSLNETLTLEEYNFKKLELVKVKDWAFRCMFLK